METRRENFEAKNVRFLGYNLLKSVTFEGEPVVPVILSEEHNSVERYFYVEKLGGIDLVDLMSRGDVTLVDKLSLVHHVVGQLQAIDKAGIILFDRASRNIRVLSWGSSGNSTRQVDIEVFFDKNGGGYYAGGDRLHHSTIKAKAMFYEENGFNMWSDAVANLSEVAKTMCYYDTRGGPIMRMLGKYTDLSWPEYRGESNPMSKLDVLKIFKEDLEGAIRELDPKYDFQNVSKFSPA